MRTQGYAIKVAFCTPTHDTQIYENVCVKTDPTTGSINIYKDRKDLYERTNAASSW